MIPGKSRFLSGTIWATTGFGISQIIRLLTNVVLTRILAPEIFGVINIVRSLMIGVELTSDIGISQNIVQSSRGLETALLNTAWTLQIFRGVLLFFVFLIISPTVANLYHEPVFSLILPIVAIGFIFSGFTSTSIFVLQKRFQFSLRIGFDVAIDCISAFIYIALAFLYPNIWSMVFGLVAVNLTRAIGSHLLIRGFQNRIQVSRDHLLEIVTFGKWVFAASAVYFMAMHFDILYFGTQLQFDILGVYGIARGLAETMYVLATRLTVLIVFPYVAASKELPRNELRSNSRGARLAFLITTACIIATVICLSDVIVRLLYDKRYEDAIWMLHILCIGSWLRILNELNGSVLLGIGRPIYTALGNTAKLAAMLVGIPVAFHTWGLQGAIAAIACTELCNYIVLYTGARREQVGFGQQDALATFALIVFIGVIEWFRWSIGFDLSLARN